MAPTKCIEMAQTGTVCWSPGISWTLNHRLRFTRQVRNPKRSLPAFRCATSGRRPHHPYFPPRSVNGRLHVSMRIATCAEWPQEIA
jgi:hypothetical protein